MERLTIKLPEGGYSAGEKTQSEILDLLGHYEDAHDAMWAELEYTARYMERLSAAGQSRSSVYSMMMGSRYMLEDMIKRLEETKEETDKRLTELQELLRPFDEALAKQKAKEKENKAE